ncbi:PIN domain nuclease, a component of toxin-antitoxin system (PIN domain) [Granulicella rosea]|uniref:PIN domain nuclease, a component of toxin-antitoxin system (PIN domain) n=1 Tax=Granulicella rosea TaxID=474952 RepID=A0A239HW76_9BACT|nr:type II toxin-antitoxin system VapC family toxin [Granulicella rosea]SNS84444.1 PIN domain nuclease, a component of toxin-antitoxin system (PIN domain) [Granulicella rosea]
MRVLLDTHALVWAVLASRSLSKNASELIADEENEIVVSAASAWEIATKVRLGKMPEAAEFEMNFLEDIGAAGYEMRAITVEDGLRAGRLMGPHQDPFDRMIAAQALADDIPVISIDPKLDGFGIRRIW